MQTEGACMRRSTERFGLLTAIALCLCMAAPVAAQDVSPLTPMSGKDGPRSEPSVETPPGGQGVVIPLPQAANRVEAADRSRIRVTAALPASWISVSTRYQPYWSGVEPAGAFG